MKHNFDIKHDIKQGLFGQIAENFDSKNDLNFYINISSTLNKINKNKYSLNLIKFSENKLIDHLILELIKAEISVNHYNPNLDRIFDTITNKIKDIYELINLLQKNSIILSKNNNEPQTFLFKNLGEILSNEGRLFALKDIASILNQHCQLNLNTDPKQAQHSLLKLAYEALNKVTNYQDVQTNIQLLLNNYQLNSKE